MTILKEAQKIAYFATITKMRNLQLWKPQKLQLWQVLLKPGGCGTSTNSTSPPSPQYWWFKIGRSIDDPTLMLIIQILESFKTGFNVSLGICVYINYGLYRNIYPNIYYIYILDFGEFKQDSEFLDICVSINWFPF